MEVRRTQLDGVSIFSLHGRFDAAAAPEAELHFKNYIREEPKSVVVDLGDVEYISSGGLRVIIMLAKAVERNEGALRLCALNPFVSEVFELTNLDKKYQVFPTRGEAVASLRAGS